MATLSFKQFQSPGLAPFDLTVEPGQCIALSGPSGSGKTRLLRALADLDPSSGNIAIDAIQRKDIPAPEWRKQVGYLAAESHWWSEVVGDHFIEADEQHTLLKTLGFTNDTLDWDVSRLSSGEKQRLALARLLSGNPVALLLDEPTANLDQSNIERVEALLAEYRTAHQCAVIWVSHDPSQQSRVADRRFTIAQGKLVEQL